MIRVLSQPPNIGYWGSLPGLPDPLRRKKPNLLEEKAIKSQIIPVAGREWNHFIENLIFKMEYNLLDKKWVYNLIEQIFFYHKH